MDIKTIVIVGGGTAGWLAANHIGQALADNTAVTVTLIESPDIPTIGVGEGTVPAIRSSLKRFGISEAELIRSCDATFKQSIKFVNWLDKERHGEHNFYHHLFDSPLLVEEALTPVWLQNKQGYYGDVVSPQHAVCEAYKGPKQITHAEYKGSLGYAYHLNAAKFAQLLAANATSRFKVEHIRANVVAVNLNDSGDIASIETDSHGTISADFYIDCSGFEALLIDKTLKVPFVDKSKQLFVDKAIAVQVPIADDAPIAPFTLATAHQAGWIWDIALTQRRGIGFVYASKYMSEATALKKLATYIGDDLAKFQYRILPMRLGYRERFMHQNCLSLGLAQGFLEPLEATSILLTDFAAGFFANRLPKHKAELSLIAEQLNKVMSYAWERVVEFIKLHYCISDRTDAPFWVDNRDSNSIPPALADRLQLWQNHIPSRQDFFSKFEVFDLENYLYVLYGMQFNTRPHAGENQDHQASWQSRRQKGQQMTAQLVDTLPDHRDLLQKIIRYGLQKN